MKPVARIIIIAAAVLLMISIAAKLLDREEESDIKQPAHQDNPVEIIIEPQTRELTVKLYNHWSKELVEMPIEEYLIGVVAGEMPASFELEALKAQAVAARTLVVHQMREYGGRGCNQKEGADVCSSYAHCQEWLPEERMRKNWGSSYEENYEKIKQAVMETKGRIITYNGKPIEVFYHSTSNGKTEDVREVFSSSLPYYVSVDSAGEEDAPKFEGSVTYTNQEFADIFYSKYKVRLNPDNLKSQIKINGYTDSGRIRDLTVGGIRLKATEFRLLYGLNSTDITFIYNKNTITMKTKGFGHGVGMSQVGADRMAEKGYSYTDILKHYYKGVEISHY